jgi:hypothetical protein
MFVGKVMNIIWKYLSKVSFNFERTIRDCSKHMKLLSISLCLTLVAYDFMGYKINVQWNICPKYVSTLLLAC